MQHCNNIRTAILPEIDPGTSEQTAVRPLYLLWRWLDLQDVTPATADFAFETAELPLETTDVSFETSSFTLETADSFSKPNTSLTMRQTSLSRWSTSLSSLQTIGLFGLGRRVFSLLPLKVNKINIQWIYNQITEHNIHDFHDILTLKL